MERIGQCQLCCVTSTSDLRLICMDEKKLLSWLGCILCLACISDPGIGWANSNTTAFRNNYCVDCHSGPSPAAGFDALEIEFGAMDRTKLATLTRVVDRISAGEMPPADADLPSKEEANAFLAETRLALKRAYANLYEREGRVVLRRLNPTEYEYSLRDLLRAPWLELREILPADPEMDGFDNSAEAQEFSYVQMTRFLEAAEVAIDGAMMLRPAPEAVTARVAFGQSRRFVNRDGWAMMFRQPNSAQAPWRISAKRQREPGWYRFRVHCRAVRYEDGAIVAPHRDQVASINTASKRFLATFNVSAKPTIVEFVGWLHQDDLLEFYCADLSDRQCPKDNDVEPRPFRGDGVALEYLEITGPFASRDCDPESKAWPPESYRTLFANLQTKSWTPASGLKKPNPLHLPDRTGNKRGVRNPYQEPVDMTMVVSDRPRNDAERLLREFMPRAYRRPVPESEVQRCLGFALRVIDEGACFQDAMRLAYQAVLCSPDFVYFRESPGKLDDYAIATRLSYFLWRSLPDATLLKKAERGLLQDAENLQEEVARLLSDPKSDRFVSDFCGQWLDLRKLHDTSPDKSLFPEYYGDTHLFQSAKAETEATFRRMLDENLPVLNVVRSDDVLINERLAELYSIPGVKGCELRRVPIPADSLRGGFLTQASVMKVTANGLNTSPVTRGAWVLDRILGTPPAPPPPGAGSIEPDTRGATTIREQLKQHRQVESCANCHQLIDPPGFALESFDVMGGWRDHYRSSENGERQRIQFASKNVSVCYGLDVDSSGKVADGRRFSDYNEYRELLVQQEEQIAHNLVRRLMTFATGGGINFVDRAAVEDILRTTNSAGHGLRSIVEQIVLSETFRHK